MIDTQTPLFRLVSGLMLVCMAPMAIPMQPLAEAVAKSQANRKVAEKLAPSRLLSSQECKTLKGRLSAQNPYMSGSSKWSVVQDGVDLTTGSLMLSGTDLSFEGGYGVPVNVTRTYCSNRGDEGPLGIGWQLSTDLRTTAGGMLKKAASPVRTVPVEIRERPSMQGATTTSPSGFTSPFNPNEPVNAMTAVDASGMEETLQRDLDGVVFPPGWDGNRIETQYEWAVLPDGREYEVASTQVVTTPEGTTYYYSKHGEYGRFVSGQWRIDGLYNFRDNDLADSDYEPSNIMKVDQIVDRYGNTTTFAYSTDFVHYNRINGEVRENKLLSVSMPNGQHFSFTYGAGNLSNRIVSVNDGTQTTDRKVSYGYDNNGNLTSVTSPEGHNAQGTPTGYRTTQYGYAGVSNTTIGASSAQVLCSVTDPTGQVTAYLTRAWAGVAPLGYYVGPTMYTYEVQYPTGYKKHFEFGGNTTNGIPQQHLSSFTDLPDDSDYIMPTVDVWGSNPNDDTGQTYVHLFNLHHQGIPNSTNLGSPLNSVSLPVDVNPYLMQIVSVWQLDASPSN